MECLEAPMWHGVEDVPVSGVNGRHDSGSFYVSNSSTDTPSVFAIRRSGTTLGLAFFPDSSCETKPCVTRAFLASSTWVHPFARRIRVTFQVAGDSICDRLLRRFVGDRVEVSMTNWGGTIVVVTGDFRRTASTLMTCIEPLAEQTCLQHVLVYSEHSRLGAPVDNARLFIRRLFTHGFMAQEFTTLAGIRYAPDRFLDCDRLMVDFFQWVARLPHAADERDPVSSGLEHISL